MENKQKRLIILLGALAILSIAATLYFLYFPNFLYFKTLATLSYDAQIATQLLTNPQTIVFTKDKEVALSDLKGDKLLLVPGGNNFSDKMAGFKISQSRKYITWQSEVGIVGLDVSERKVFLIYAGEPRQSYDLSPLNDKILFVTKDNLRELNLKKDFFNSGLSLPLPKLANPKAAFNHIKYAPNGQLAYIRSIHEFNVEKKDDIETGIVNLKKSNINLLEQPFTTSVDLSPVWSNDSAKLIAWRHGLVTYDLSNHQIAALISQQNFDTLSPYAINLQNGTIAYIDSGSNNPEIIVTDSAGTILTKPVNARDKRLGEGFGILSDVGWLSENMIWFTFNSGANVRDLWIIKQDGSDMIKVIDGIDKYSLESVFMPITNAYTLY